MTTGDAEEDAIIDVAISRGETHYSSSDKARLAGRLIVRVRELSKTIEKQGNAMGDLTERIRKLNVWLLGVTLAIGALTLVQIAVALKWIGR